MVCRSNNFLYHRLVSALWWDKVFLTTLLGPNHVLTVVTVSVTAGVMSKNKLVIPVCPGFPTLTRYMVSSVVDEMRLCFTK